MSEGANNRADTRNNKCMYGIKGGNSDRGSKENFRCFKGYCTALYEKRRWMPSQDLPRTEDIVQEAHPPS